MNPRLLTPLFRQQVLNVFVPLVQYTAGPGLAPRTPFFILPLLGGRGLDPTP